MEKETHFRIIELPEYQVLLTKDFDEDEESNPLLTITFFYDGVKVSQKLGYTDEQKRDKVFDEITDAQAQEFVDGAIKMFN